MNKEEKQKLDLKLEKAKTPFDDIIKRYTRLICDLELALNQALKSKEHFIKLEKEYQQENGKR